MVGDYAQDFPAYLGREVSVVNARGELAYGIDAEPARTRDRFIDTPAFLVHWRSDRVVYALMRRGLADTLLTPLADIPCTVVAESPRYILFVNRRF